MKKTFIFAAIGLLFSFLVSSCYFDNVEDLYPFEASACDTANVTYSQTVAPIMASSCNVCHSVANPQKNIITDNFTDLSIIAKNGQLWKSVSHDPGVIPMPYQGNKLPDCNLKKINTWIKAGSPDN
jgi:hypothetical protein